MFGCLACCSEMLPRAVPGTNSWHLSGAMLFRFLEGRNVNPMYRGAAVCTPHGVVNIEMRAARVLTASHDISKRDARHILLQRTTSETGSEDATTPVEEPL